MQRIDPRTRSTNDHLRLPGAPGVFLARVWLGAVWVWTKHGCSCFTNPPSADDTLWRIDPKTREAERVGGWHGPKGSFNLTPQPSVPAGSWWWFVGSPSVAVYDLATAKLVAAFHLPFGIPTWFGGFAEGNGSGWVSNQLDDTVWQLDPSTGLAREIHVGKGPRGIAFGEGSIWVANQGDGTVSRIDPASGKVVATIEVGGNPASVAVGEGGVWVTVYPE